MAYKHSFLKALLLSYLYYCIVFTFPYSMKISPNLFIGDNLNSFTSFFLLYLIFINNFQAFFSNSMFLARNKSFYSTVLRILKSLLPMNILYTLVFIIVINIVNFQHFGRIDLLYTIKFFVLINLCFILLNFISVIFRILWGGTASLIGGLSLVVLNIFSILYKKEGQDFLYMPLSLHEAPTSTLQDLLKLVMILFLYASLAFLFIFLIKKIYYGRKKHVL